jgi:hypothetical protein
MRRLTEDSYVTLAGFQRARLGFLAIGQEVAQGALLERSVGLNQDSPQA